MPPEDLHDLIESLTQSPETVARLIKDIPEATLRFKHSPDEFSVLENICHLRDIEVEGYAARISRILNGDNPFLSDIDGGRLAIERDYQSQELSQAVQAFTNARKQNIQILSSVSTEQFDRQGTMEGMGSVSIRGLLLMMRDHDAGHLDELASIRERAHSAR